MTQTNSVSWITPMTLDCPGLVRTIRLVPLEAHHAVDLFTVADKELFRHSMQAPPEWSVRGFELELTKVISLPGTVAFAIVLACDDRDKRAGQAIGRTTFMDIKPEHRGLEIGRTWIGRAYHGTRANPEAKYLMLRHAFESLSPTAIRVQLTTNGTNMHSQAAIAKLGAVREGVLRKARIMPAALDRTEPAVRDWVHYSIVDDEWLGVKAQLERRLSRMG
ncbi:MAG: GNAT family N-acetyltransferase [Phycisphaeraceae bacterium]|nr:GNAT family N-acetyltransferase [Phycisphaeraceae bacterium]